ncbi:MAG TPA: acetylxylan esterase [Armatimonadetes bacterium]|nr:acetylxylan esterase [Armatimonadota bacterium]
MRYARVYALALLLGLPIGGESMAQDREIVRQFDTLVFCQQLYAQMRPRLTFQAKTKREAIEWQAKLRRQLIRLLGGFPKRRCPLMPEVLNVQQLKVKLPDGRVVTYKRETVVFQSRKNLSVYGYFLIPDKFKAPGPCVICLPGHGRGVDDIVGINEDGSLRETFGGYQADFALQCVANGFAVLAIEQLGFGHRRDERAHRQSAGASSCQPAAGAALIFGQTMIGWRVYDVMRALDYLETRPEVDAKRIAVMGISGGGTIALFSTALEARIKAAVISGYFNTFRDSIMSIPHCIDNYIPGILKYAEMFDIAGLIAPRPLFIESGTEDPIFPVEATKFAFEKLKRIYKVFGATDRLGLEIFKGEHSFHGKGAFAFLKRWL